MLSRETAPLGRWATCHQFEAEKFLSTLNASQWVFKMLCRLKKTPARSKHPRWGSLDSLIQEPKEATGGRDWEAVNRNGLPWSPCPGLCSVVFNLRPHGLSSAGLLCLGLSRQECWRDLPLPSPGPRATQGLSPHLCACCAARGILYLLTREALTSVFLQALTLL